MANKLKKVKSKAVTILPEGAKVVAIIIGLETYMSRGGKTINPVAHAKDDAKKFKDELVALFPDHEVNAELLIDDQASKSNIESEIKAALYSLDADDLFVLFYAGHGFHDGTSNLLTASDSHPDFLPTTCVSLRDNVLDPLTETPCKKSLIFIDACAQNLNTGSDARDVITDLKDKELKAFLSLENYAAVYLSCAPGQKSYSNKSLGHGIWTYHVLQAFRGKAEQAIGPDNYLTDSSLKDYLSVAVPKYIRQKTNIRGIQKPMAMISASNTFALCQFEDTPTIIADKFDFTGVSFKPDFQCFSNTETRQFDRLPGFTKSKHFIPDRVSSESGAFAEGLLSDEIREEMADYYKATKSELGLRKRDIEYEDDRLDTDAYRFWIEVRQNPRDPKEVEIIRSLIVRTGDAETYEAVSQIFGDIFDRYTCKISQLTSSFDDIVEFLEDMVDAHGGNLEEDEKDQLAEYTAPNGITLRFDLLDGSISVEKSSGQSFLDLYEILQTIRLGAPDAPITYLDNTFRD